MLDKLKNIVAKPIFICGCIFSISIFSCTHKNTEEEISFENQRFGGNLKINEPENFISLYPYHIEDATSLHIVNQLYEGLLKFDAKGDTVVLNLADSISIDSSETNYRFHIKSGVFFHDNLCFSSGKGRMVSAYDVLFSFSQILSSENDNLARDYFVDILRGASEYARKNNAYQDSNSFEGLRVINFNTLEFRLNRKDPNFLYKLATPYAYIVCKEALAKYGRKIRTNPVGTGPFYLKSENDLKEDSYIELQKHGHYHQSVNNILLPYLDKITFNFIKESGRELEMFKEGVIDIIHDQQKNVLEEMQKGTKHDYDDYGVIKSKDLSSVVLGFDTRVFPFSNTNVRKAFLQSVYLQNIGSIYYDQKDLKFPYIINNQLVVNSLIEDSLRISFNQKEAKATLKNNGLNSENFKSSILYINSLGKRNNLLAQKLVDYWKKYLKIEIEIIPVPLNFHYQNIKQGKSPLFLTEINYLYPSAEFLTRKCYSFNRKSNYYNYYSAEYDKEYQESIRSNYAENTFHCATKLQKDLPLHSITDVYNVILYQPHVKGLVWNRMNYLDLRKVYFQEPQKVFPVQN